MSEVPPDPSHAGPDDRLEDDGDGDPVDPLPAGLEQFQRAALEAIRAGRAMLDAAESLIQDPKAAEAVARTVGAAARTATEAVSSLVGHRPAGDAEPAAGDTEPAAGGAEPAAGDAPSDGFERISVD